MSELEISPKEMAENAASAASLLKSMANENRLMILCQIAETEMSVGELSAAVPLSQSALSQHLAVLRKQKIVQTRRDAQSIFYSLASEEARTLIACLYEVFCAPKR